MEEIDGFGTFWIASEAEPKALSGHLSFDPESGARLTLVGESSVEQRLGTEDPDLQGPLRLHGWISSKKLTLLECHLTGTKRGHQGTIESTFIVNEILRGVHLNGDVEFQAGHLSTTGAADWIGRRVISASRPTEPDEKEISWLDYKRPRAEQSLSSNPRVTMSYSWKSSGDGSTRSIRFEHWPVFSILYPQIEKFDKIREDLGRIQDLITLCTDRISLPDSILLNRPDLKVQMLGGGEGPYEQDIEYLAASGSGGKDDKTLHSFEMLLTYDEIGGIETVDRFVRESPLFARSLNSLVSVRRLQKLYGENRFLNVAFAAEAFHRDVFGGKSLPDEDFAAIYDACLGVMPKHQTEWLEQRLKFANELTLRNRLRALVELAGKESLPFVTHFNRWISVVVGVRNSLTHLVSDRADFDGADLYYLSESIYSLVRACILAHIGAPMEIVAQKASTDRFSWYSDRLNRTIERLRKQL